MEGLADKVVLVTGGSSGIGEACARRLAVEGCAVMVAGRDEAKTEGVAESLLPAGKHGWVTGDVRAVGDCQAVVTATMERYGQLDVLVHCAGVWDERPTLDVTEDDWDGVLETNLKGAFFTMQAALAPMVEAGGGVIVVIASDSGYHGEPGAAAYAASKAGVISLVRTLAHDHGPDGVRVVAVAPGIIETPMLAQAIADAPTRRRTRPCRPTGTPSAGSAAPRRSPPWWPSSPATRLLRHRRLVAGRRRLHRVTPPPADTRRRALLADAALLSVAILWGLNFVVIKDAIADTGPMTYLLWRHVLAAIMLAAVMPRTALQTRRRDWLYGGVLGVFLFIAFATQTIGLQWTTPGKSGFITSLYIVMVPFLYWIVARRSPGWAQVGGAVLATVGLGLLSFRGGLGMSKGDLLTLIGALGFAAQIAATGFFAPRTKPAVLALTQIVAAAALFVIVTPFVEHVTWDFGWRAWAAIVWTALAGTVFGFLVQAWAQKSTTSTRAGVILGLEGLFAAAFGLIFGLDVLSWRFVVGAVLILAGVIVIETLPGRRGEPNPADVLPRAD